MPTLWVDVDDLLAHVQRRERMTGIFRVVHELCAALHRDGARFVRHAPGDALFIEIDWPPVVRAIAAVEAAHRLPAGTGRSMPAWLQTPARALFRQLPPVVAVALGVSLQGLKAFGFGLAGLPAAWRQSRATAAAMALHERPFRPGPGDVIFSPGAPWVDRLHALRVATARSRGLRYALLVHDIIPLRRPEWCSLGHTLNFAQWFTAVAPQADHLLAISHATAEDVMTHASRNGMDIVTPQVVPMGTGFTLPPLGTPSTRLPKPGSYVLFVSTLEGRKNHILAVRIWRRLLEEMPAGSVPQLVFVGRPGPQTLDLMGQLSNSNYLDGAILHLDDASDSELRQLYEGCRFTLFPSLYEGWGLPVTESLAFGRPCLAARATSLPEAGGTFARYFDPDNLHDAVAVVRAALEDEAGMEEMAAQIRADFRAATWDDMATAARRVCTAAPPPRLPAPPVVSETRVLA